MKWDSSSQSDPNSNTAREDPTPGPQDVEFMALVLEGRHGKHAAEVAAFFSDYHSEKGDAGRSWAWAGVAEIVRLRDQERRDLNSITLT